MTSRAQFFSEILSELRVQRGREVAEMVANSLGELLGREAWVAIWGLRDVSRAGLRLRQLVKGQAERESLQLLSHI